MSLIQDVRFFLRVLRRNPLFAGTAILCLALGIGSTTAMFAVVDAVLLKPLPYPDAHRIVGIWNHLSLMNLPWMETSAPEYLDHVERNEVFSELGAYITGAEATILEGGESEAVVVGLASPSLFRLLAVRAALGRTFTEEEAVPGRDRVVLLSHGLWQRRFASDPGILGRGIDIDGDRLVVVGVLPPEFRLANGEVQIWGPLAIDPANLPPRRQRFLHVLGRLKDGVSLAQAQAGMEALVAQSYREHPDIYPRQGWQVELVPMKEHLVRPVRPALTTLLAAVALVLLVACANVANLLVVRAVAREGEITVRLALGAGRSRIFRQLLTESLLLALLGGALGLALAYAAIGLLGGARPDLLPRVDEIRVGGGALALAALVAAGTGVAFGLVPAAQLLGRKLETALRATGRTSSAGRGRNLLRRSLLVAEVALSFVLLVGAGLLIRSFAAAQSVDPGFEPRNVLTLKTSLHYLRYAEPASVRGFYQALEERLAGLPGVTAVGAVSILPLSGAESQTTFAIQGRPPRSGEGFPSADLRVATPGYHRAIGIELLAGRTFAPSDDAQAPGVALVDEELARRHFADADPIERRIQLGSAGQGPWLTIVGVVGHAKQDGLDRESRGLIYLPHSQRPAGAMTAVVRTGSDPLAIGTAARRAVGEIDPSQAVSEMKTLEQVLDDSLALRRLSSLLLGGFAVIALLIATVGIYGVIAYNVAQRRREIGLRLVVGAQRRDVMRLILGQGAVLIALGLALGLGAAASVSHLLEALLFGIGAYDPVIYILVSVVLAAAGLIASYLPARRALKLDPTVVLREG